MKLYKRLISAVSAIAVIATLSGCGALDNSSVATVNGIKIPKTDFTFFLTQVKSQIEQQQNTEGAADFWETAENEGKKVLDSAKEKALDEAIKSTLIRQKAKENNLKITKEDEGIIEKQKTDIITKVGGKDKYLAELKKMGLTEKTYDAMLENDMFAQKLQETLIKDVDDSKVKAYYNSNIARVKHVLILTIDEQTNSQLPKEKLDAAKTRASNVLSLAKGGQDFDELVAQYSEDPGSKTQPEGYYLGKGFTLGQEGGMVPSFEKASLDLAVGGVSDIVETNYGYHIIKRYANEESVFEKNKDELVFRTKYDKFEQIQELWKAEAKIVINEKELAKIK